MHKYLYGTVAVTALSALIFAQPAQSAGDISLDTSMYYAVALAIHEDDSDNDVHFFSTRQDGEIHFDITSKFENELEISAHVELEAATTGDQIDEGYIDVKGKFGLLRIGADDAVSEAMTFGIPSAGVPGGSVDDPTFIYSRSGVQPDTGINGIGGDSNGIRYFTPRVEGFQFGVSYQPDGEASGGNFGSGGLLGDNDSVENVFSVAVNFDRQFENVALKASAFYQTAEDNRAALSGADGLIAVVNTSGTGVSPGLADFPVDPDPSFTDITGPTSPITGTPLSFVIAARRLLDGTEVGAPGGVVGPNDPVAYLRGDPTSYGFAFTVGFGGFEIGGAWSEQSDANIEGIDISGYGIGLSYGKDAWKFGGQWVHTEIDSSNSPGLIEATRRFNLQFLPPNDAQPPSKDEIDAFALEASYALGAGVTLGGGLYYYSIDSATSRAFAGVDIDDSYAAAVVLGLAF